MKNKNFSNYKNLWGKQETLDNHIRVCSTHLQPCSSTILDVGVYLLRCSVFKVSTSTSIFSAISASILKISVPIIKRRSWRFQNTPRNQLSDEYWPRKQQKQSGTKTACLKLNKTPIFEDLPFSLKCCNLAQNNPNFASWGCFGILRTSSWWWAQRFLKLMQK